MTLPSKGFPLFLLNLLLSFILIVGHAYLYAIALNFDMQFLSYLLFAIPFICPIFAAFLWLIERRFFGKEMQMTTANFAKLMGFFALNALAVTVVVTLFANFLVNIIAGPSAAVLGPFLIPPFSSFLNLSLALILLSFEKSSLESFFVFEQGEEKAKRED